MVLYLVSCRGIERTPHSLPRYIYLFPFSLNRQDANIRLFDTGPHLLDLPYLLKLSRLFQTACFRFHTEQSL